MTQGTNLVKWIIERNKAFETGDLEWAHKLIPNASSPAVVEIAFHKARLECLDVSKKRRRESRDWLRERGLTRLDGSPVTRRLPE